MDIWRIPNVIIDYFLKYVEALTVFSWLISCSRLSDIKKEWNKGKYALNLHSLFITTVSFQWNNQTDKFNLMDEFCAIFVYSLQCIQLEKFAYLQFLYNETSTFRLVVEFCVQF